MKNILETERLILRQLIFDDSKFIIELLNSEGWIKYIGDRNVKTEDDAKNYLRKGAFKSYAENGYGLWLVETKETKTPIGMCGIINRADLENPDIGFAFLPQYSGKGYAFEIAQATLNYAIKQLNLPIILGITVSYNLKSINLLKKIGLKYVKNINLPGDPDELMLFSN
jgi:RimJ/RimL family protein N-acetyltransferase